MANPGDFLILPTADLWTMIVALLIPALVAFVIEGAWTARQKRLTLVIIAAGVATAELAVRGQLVFDDWLRTTFLLAILAHAVYHRFHRPFDRLAAATGRSPTGSQPP